MKAFLLWLECLLFDHDFQPAGYEDHNRASWEAWEVCARCGRDSRETWMIEDENHCILERIEEKLRNKQP